MQVSRAVIRVTFLPHRQNRGQSAAMDGQVLRALLGLDRDEVSGCSCPGGFSQWSSGSFQGTLPLCCSLPTQSGLELYSGRGQTGNRFRLRVPKYGSRTKLGKGCVGEMNPPTLPRIPCSHTQWSDQRPCCVMGFGL